MYIKEKQANKPLTIKLEVAYKAENITEIL